MYIPILYTIPSLYPACRIWCLSIILCYSSKPFIFLAMLYLLQIMSKAKLMFHVFFSFKTPSETGVSSPSIERVEGRGWGKPWISRQSHKHFANLI